MSMRQIKKGGQESPFLCLEIYRYLYPIDLN